MSKFFANLKPYLLLVLGIAIGVAFTNVWSLIKKIPTVPVDSKTLIAHPSDSLPKSGRLSVNDQKAGDSVLIESVTVPPPGVWIAVHPVTNTGLGAVLGAALVREPHTNLSVDLVFPTKPGNHYAVVLYRDNGDTEFDPASDSVYVDFETGVRVEERFSTLSN